MNMNDFLQNGQPAEPDQTRQRNSEDGSSSTPQQRMRGSDQLKGIADLLAGAIESDDPPPAPEPPAPAPEGELPAPEGDDQAPAPAGEIPGKLTVKQLAERLDVDPAKLYDALEIPVGDNGETVTLDKLKATFQGQAEAAQGTATKAAELDQREAAISSDVQALGVLEAMQVLPDNIRSAATMHMQEMAVREWSKFTALVPELQDDAARIQYDNDARSHLKEYGLTPDHFGVRTVGMLRLMRDAVNDRKKLKALLKPKPAQAPTPVKRNRQAQPGAKPAQNPRGAQGRRAEIGAIANMLQGTKQ